LKDPHDVFFLNQLEFVAIPKGIKQAVRNQVIRGAGIVIVGETTTALMENLTEITISGTKRSMTQVCSFAT